VRAVLQRVREAAVRVVEPGPRAAEAAVEREIARIGPGLVALVGFAGDETPADLEWMAQKILALRLFGPDGEFERSVVDVGGEVLLVSQFTLLADVRKGRRPDFGGAAPASRALRLYENLVEALASRFPGVRQGVFGATMRLALVNDGPVTLVLERGPAGPWPASAPGDIGLGLP
jgi:D-tyrosyl-tRNA(Tyr) deacylase